MPKPEGRCEVTIVLRDPAVIAGLRTVAGAEDYPTLDACVENLLRAAFRAALEGGRKMSEAEEAIDRR